MRSVVVVLPASIWAMMPILRQRSNGTVRGILSLYSLPPVMREGLVGFRHAVDVFFLFHGRALAVGGIEQLIGQLVGHAFFAAPAAVTDEPADSQRSTPVGIHFHRHLIVGAAYAPRLHFQQRLHVFHGFLEELERFVAALLLKLLHGVVKNGLRGGLLAVPHHGVHKL